MKFIGRSTELASLEEHYASSKGELFILYGRRRVGKTELLAHFCRSKPAIYFTASQAEVRDNLAQLSALTHQFFDDSLLKGMVFQDIETVLNYLLKKSKQKRLIVVLDEFQYWIMGNKAIPSQLQRFWDQAGKSSNLMLVLCGSSVSMMMEYTLAEKAPLYGRRTGQLELKPFDYRVAGKFFPSWSAQDKIVAHSILGGIPAYLSQFHSELSLQENIKQKILRKGTFLSEEANFVLQTELRDTKTYTSLLRAIAAGNTTLKDLTSKMGMDARAISTYLNNLQTLHLIKREVSILERAPEKSRKGRYLIQDNFLSFWFRFVQPNITLLEINEGAALFNQIIEPLLKAYMGIAFEKICQQYVLYYGRESGLPLPKRIGQIWEKDFGIDVVAENIDKSYTFGECKWSSNISDVNIAQLLMERAHRTQLATDQSHFVLFLKAGLKSKRESRFIIVDSEKLF